MNVNKNHILPEGSQFSAVVNGKPTGLAGCTRTAECWRSAQCLRADERLKSRADMCAGQQVSACRVFIPA